MNRSITAALGILILMFSGAPARVFAQGPLQQRVDDLSRQITAKISATQKTTIAVVEFADLEGRVTNFGRFLAEELITRLHETEKFKVIERQLLNKVINELMPRGSNEPSLSVHFLQRHKIDVPELTAEMLVSMVNQMFQFATNPARKADLN